MRGSSPGSLSLERPNETIQRLPGAALFMLVRELSLFVIVTSLVVHLFLDTLLAPFPPSSCTFDIGASRQCIAAVAASSFSLISSLCTCFFVLAGETPSLVVSWAGGQVLFLALGLRFLDSGIEAERRVGRAEALFFLVSLTMLAVLPRAMSLVSGFIVAGLVLSRAEDLLNRIPGVSVGDKLLNALWIPRRWAWYRFVAKHPIHLDDRSRWLLAARSEAIRALPEDIRWLLCTQYVIAPSIRRFQSCFARVHFLGGPQQRCCSSVPAFVVASCSVELEDCCHNSKLRIIIDHRVIFEERVVVRSDNFVVAQKTTIQVWVDSSAFDQIASCVHK